MSTNLYRNQKELLYKNIVATTKNDQLLRNSFSFNMVSASLTNFLPNCNSGSHLHLYKEILFHQQLSLLDQFHPELVEGISGHKEKEIIAQLKHQPGIIVTFHTGSYRLLNHFLLLHKIPFTLVLASQVLKEQGEQFHQLSGEYHFRNTRKNFDCIDAEKPTAALQMLRTLNSGQSLLVYIDGNTGAQSRSAKENLLALDFLKGKLLIRKGIGAISFAAKAPIHCLASWIETNGIATLHHLGRIMPDIYESRELYVRRSLTFLYAQLATIVHRYPGQWEGWLYLHKSVQPVAEHTALPVAEHIDSLMMHNFFRFNSDDFGIFIMDEQYFLLHKRSYTFYQIDQQLFDCWSRDFFDQSSIPDAKNALAELLKNAVIRPARLSV